MSQLAVEIHNELLACHIIVETQMMTGILSFPDDSTELHNSGIASRRKENGIAKMRIMGCMELVVSHGIVGTLEPQNVLGIFQSRAIGTGNPKPF